MIHAGEHRPAAHSPRHAPPRPLPGVCQGCTLLCADLCRVIRENAPLGTRPPMTRHFDQDALVVGQGQTPGFSGFLRRGHVREAIIRPNGDRILQGLASPGDLVVGPPGHASVCDVEAATDIELCTIDRITFQSLMTRSAHFRKVVQKTAALQRDRLLGWAWRLNALDSRERIIAFLVEMTRIMPTEPQPDGSLILTVEVSRRDWADLTKTAVETISRTMRYLADKNMVVSLTSCRFRIRNLDRLAYLAGVEPPQRPSGLRAAPALPDRPGSSPESAKRMIAVNAPGRGTDKIRAVPKFMTAQARGLARRRLHHVEKEVRS